MTDPREPPTPDSKPRAPEVARAAIEIPGFDPNAPLRREDLYEDGDPPGRPQTMTPLDRPDLSGPPHRAIRAGVHRACRGHLGAAVGALSKAAGNLKRRPF